MDEPARDVTTGANDGRRGGGGRFVLWVVRWLVVLWACGLTFYFQVKEGVVRWPWLYQSAAVAEGAATPKGWERFQFERPASADMPQAPYAMIYKNALGPYDVRWGNAPWRELAIDAGMLVGYTLLGWLLLCGFRVFLPRGARLALALAMGCGTLGVGAELLGLAHQVNRIGVAGLWAGLLMLGAACWFVRFSRRNILEAFTTDTRISPAEQDIRAAEWFGQAWAGAGGALARVTWAVFAVLFGLINLLMILHAAGEPVSYWDSLILYVGYARGIFLEHGFPLKIVGQVGVGLGANYPHLYELLTAQTAALAGYWSPVFAQLLPPVAVLAALVLVYFTVAELSGDRLVAMACALLVRCVPYGMSYSQFASNYSVAILFTAAFAYLAVRLVKDGLPGYRNLMLLMAAFSVHVNYLMWGLWPMAILAIALAHFRYRAVTMHHPAWQQADPGTPLPAQAPEFMVRSYRPRLGELLRQGRLWLWLAAAVVIACPWYVRNTVLAGNPVYAFYSNIFPSKNVNPAVMKSAEVEWRLNGDGLANVGHTLGEKLRGSWLYFVTGAQHWKLAPVFMGLVVPGFVLWLLWWAVAAARARANPASELQPGAVALVNFRAVAAPAALFLLLWFYAYAVADFYLYQIIEVLPLLGVFAAWVFMLCRGRGQRAVLYTLTLVIALAPGIPMALMGFKLKKSQGVAGPPPQFALTALRKLFMEPTQYYRQEYDGDYEMLTYLNETLPDGTPLLTHENRHLLVKPGIKLVHLDDWEVQAGYGKGAAERVKLLDGLGVRYYLFVPNETRHIANSWLGMDELVRLGYYEKVHETDSPDEGNPEYPLEGWERGRNVLFKRTGKVAE